MKMKNIRIIPNIAPVAILSLFITGPALSQQAASKLSDPEVASVAVVANQIDIGYAQIAKKKSKDAEVLKFAETMINDHNAVLEKAGALVKKLGVTPKDNDVSKKLLADSKKTREMLEAKSGDTFDKAYVDNEVAYHKAVIDAVEGLLIPETDNAELKTLLQDVVPALKAHLSHAEMIQKNMTK
jgi:putative membrane protein